MVTNILLNRDSDTSVVKYEKNSLEKKEKAKK
jgi:hypothetical protein